VTESEDKKNKSYLALTKCKQLRLELKSSFFNQTNCRHSKNVCQKTSSKVGHTDVKDNLLDYASL